MAKADDSGLLPQRVWLSRHYPCLYRLEQSSTEDVAYVRADSQPVPAESSEYARGLRDAAKVIDKAGTEWGEQARARRSKTYSAYVIAALDLLGQVNALIPDTASPVPAGQDEVSKALAELQKMLPNESFTVEATFFNEVGPRVRIGLKDTNRHFVAPTLTEALQKVRKWREQDA